MAMQHHPLSNAALGEYLYHETVMDKQGISPANFTTKFVYDNGIVMLDNKWNYHTKMDKDMQELQHKETGGTMTNPPVTAMANPATDSHYDWNDPAYNKVPDYSFLEVEQDKKENEGVSPALDQHSIDGMDDTAFGCKVCGNAHELGINKEGVCFGCSYEEDSIRSAADETSTSNAESTNDPYGLDRTAGHFNDEATDGQRY